MFEELVRLSDVHARFFFVEIDDIEPLKFNIGVFDNRRMFWESYQHSNNGPCCEIFLEILLLFRSQLLNEIEPFVGYNE
jgi:hypothetical protein